MRISRSPFLPTALAFALVLIASPAKAAQTTRVPARITQAVDDQNRVTLRGNIHPLARSENDRGLAPDSQPIRRILLLLQRAPEQELALRKLLDEQQTKSSPNYHQWLTPEQLGEQFGPADSDIQVVSDWLTRQGFEVNRVTAGRTAIEFSGTAGMVRQSLHAEIHKYVVNGEEHWANANDPQIPAALAPVVAGFASLNNFPRKPLSHRLGTFSRSKVTGEVRPLFTFPPSNPSHYAVGPGDFATIYNVLPLWNAGLPIDGTGQTIAIVGDSNINIQDVRDFRSMFGLPAKDPVIVLDGPDPGNLGGNEEGEADLDVEWAGGVARGATIDLVVSETTESTQGTDLSALYIIDNNLAPVLSVSFGQCEAELGSGGNAFYNAMWEQAAAQGITVLVASGDSGSAACDAFTTETAAQAGLAVSGVASTPFNIAVGGTDFDDAGSQSNYFNSTNSSPLQNSALSYIPETTWNDSCAQAGLTGCNGVAATTRNLVGGGGGPSSCINPSGSFPSFTCAPVTGSSITGYARPPWQTGAGVPADNARDIPDVSLFAADGKNGSFYIMCQSDTKTGSSTSCNLSSPFTNFVGVGGTSVSTPAFAGILAMVNQKTGQRQGNANYVLYKLAAQSGASCASNVAMAAGANASMCIFYDTVTGNNSVACKVGTPNCSTPTSGTTGILVTGTAPSQTPAWTTTAGYDLASGLGTVNAANLVNNWHLVSFTPTTTTLANLSPTTITHGQSVNVTINVTSGAGTPTGAVSLVGSQPSGIGSFQLTNGSFSGTTVFLPGGTYNVTAHYAGDGNFGASDSSPVQVTVNKESSQTQVGVVTFDLNTGQVTSANATSFAYGSPYIVRANVLNSAGNTCAPQVGLGAPQFFPVSGCPTGTVTITANGSPLPNQNLPSSSLFPLNSQGYTEDLPVQFPGGSYSLAATYSGDNSFNASGPTTDSITVTPAATATSLTASASTVQTGASVTLTAVVNTQSNGAAPTGTVQFLNGGTPVAGNPAYTPTPSTTSFASLQAVLTTTFSATATITAQYNSGDANYAGSTSTATTV
ncbi:MAG TPA: Ig-like domain repeat protein, partial [Terriglobia bacterium]|nr:Ig-like domain repeat protein [Terriglobia bacterium]